MNLNKKSKQDEHSDCDIFRRRIVEMIDWTYNNWFQQNFWLSRKLSIETLSAELKPVFSCSIHKIEFSIIFIL